MLRIISPFILLIMIIANSCSSPKAPKFDIQGHRGCRGLYPENSVVAFKHALDLGVTTLEMDVVISKDKQVLVSHDPFLSHEICLDLSGNTFNEKHPPGHNLYQMSYDQIKRYDCGSKQHPRFPNQKKLISYKPLLREVIQVSEKYSVATRRSLPFYNIETKSTKEGDNVYHPVPKEFVDLLITDIFSLNVQDRVIIQSFDIRTLQYLHKQYPNIKTALLIEHQSNAESNIKALGFTPTIYSPDYTILNDEDLRYCHNHNILVIPWTVNEKEEMLDLMAMGVNGIITDYPNRLIELTEESSLNKKEAYQHR